MNAQICNFCSHFSAAPGSPVGQCRAKSPVVGGWPTVFVGDGCGEFKLSAERYNAAVVEGQRRAAEDTAKRMHVERIANAPRNESPQAVRTLEGAGQDDAIRRADRAVSHGPVAGDGKKA